MKTTIQSVTIFLFLSLSSNSVLGQSLINVNEFLKNDEGVELISFLAHPTNTFKSASWEHSSNGQILSLEIISEDNFWGGDVKTKVQFSRDGYFFTGISVLRDTDSVPPFVATAILKELLNEYLQDYNRSEEQMIGSFEKYFNKTIIEMDAYQVSLVIISLAFLSS